MTYQEFQACVEKHRPDIEEVRECAHMLHESVNQQYDKKHPYGFHLDMVADSVFKYGHLLFSLVLSIMTASRMRACHIMM